MTVDRSGSAPSTGPDLVVEITEALERQGLPEGSFVLNEHINLDALEKLLWASSADVHVYFDVQGVTVHVCKGGVSATTDEPTQSSNGAWTID